MKLMLLWIFPIAGFGFQAAAQTDACNTAQTQAEFNICAAQDWEDADAALNIAYRFAVDEMKRIDADLPASQRGAEAALRRSQRAWITVRDDTCAARGYLMHGGSAEPMLVFGCRAEMSRARTAELATLAQLD